MQRHPSRRQTSTFSGKRSNSTSDVVLHLRYTARDGGERLRKAAITELATAVHEFGQPEDQQGLARIISLRHEYPTEWYRFLNPNDEKGQTLAFRLMQDRFPFQFRGRTIKISEVDAFFKFKDITDPDVYKEGTPISDYMKSSSELKFDLTAPDAEKVVITLKSNKLFLGGLPYGTVNLGVPIDLGKGNWSLGITEASIKKIAKTLWYEVTVNKDIHPRLKPDIVEDVILVYHYSI